MTMRKLVMASTNRSAGKTSLTVGLIKASGRSFGYLKPIGDRLHYRKKRLWDYDAALMTSLFDLDDGPENMSIGFEHAKIRFVYDEKTVRARVMEKCEDAAAGKDVLFIESGADIHYGTSVNLDALSLARYADAEIVLVVSGDDYNILDDLMFLKKYVDLSGVKVAGVIANKVRDVEDFTHTHIADVKALGLPVLGVVPFSPELSYVPVSSYADRLFAKVIAGETGLNRVVKNIFVGAMSAAAAQQNPAFEKEQKLVITAGDRSDIIVTALESDTSGVVLTNNILPPSNIISRASEAGVPLLLVPWDTYYTTMQIDHMEPLLAKDDSGKVELLGKLVTEHVDFGALTKG